MRSKRTETKEYWSRGHASVPKYQPPIGLLLNLASMSKAAHAIVSAPMRGIN